MLLTKEVELKVSTRTFKYYKKLGYKFDHVGDTIIVKIEHLTTGSRAKVDYVCDYCGKELRQSYNTYCNSRKNNPKDACIHCSILYKTPESVEKKYGTPNYFSTEEFKENSKKRNLELYGVENHSQREDIKNKRSKTFLNKYGVENPFQADEIKEKLKQTNMDKYGVEFPQQSKEIREKVYKTLEEKYGERCISRIPEFAEKRKKTSLERYGFEFPSQNPDIIKKTRNTLYNNNAAPISRQQIYLHELYGGELNYPIKYYSADICFPKEKINIEYNGGGHMLNVILGKITQEEFNKKEIIRSNTIKRAGYKQITIISSHDYLPSDEILLQMLNKAKEYFNITNHTWVEYNIDTSLMRNAEYKEGVFFDYGELRKIKKIV